jgi:hypothetical protein
MASPIDFKAEQDYLIPTRIKGERSPHRQFFISDHTLRPAAAVEEVHLSRFHVSRG